MAISMKRAEQCTGRPVRRNGDDIGNIKTAGMNHVWVQLHSGGVHPIPATELDWKPMMHDKLRDALASGQDYEDAQIGYQHDSVIGYVYSSGTANDDGEDHPLYALAMLTRQVCRTWPTANPYLGFEIEEALGWAEP